MKNVIARILLISDLHWLTVPVGKQKGQVMDLLSKLFEWLIDIWKRYNVSFAIPRLLKKIAALGSLDRIICNGDLVECEWNERGMTTDTDREEIVKKTHIINSSSSSLGGVSYVPGDHELGYRLPLSSDLRGGASQKSIENFIRTVGPLWQTFTISETHFMLLCSSLMIQKTEHLPEDEQYFIRQLCLTQEAFIRETLLEISEGENVLVFLHDPDAISAFDECIGGDGNYYLHNKNIRIFCGHMHAEFVLKAYELLGKVANSSYAALLPGKIRDWARGNSRRLKLFGRYKLQIVPAPGGMLGFGGGFKVMTIFDNGAYEVEKHKVWSKNM